MSKKPWDQVKVSKASRGSGRKEEKKKTKVL